MKKFLLLLLITVLIITTCSCGSLPEGKNNEEHASEALDAFLEGIENNDYEAIKAVFSKNTLYKQEDFNSDIADLMDYFEGDILSRSKTGVSRAGREDSHWDLSAIYKVKTSEQTYIVQFELCKNDTKDQEYRGIETLSIIKIEDYEDYMGASFSKPGLYVGPPPYDNTPKNFSTIGKKHIEEVVNAIEKKDKEELQDLFSKNTLAELGNIDKDIEALFKYYEGSVIKYTESVWGKYVETEEENEPQKTGTFYYDVTTTKGTFRIAAEFCLNYNDENAEGLNSIYILKADETMNLKIPYRGDRKGTPGINIGVENLIK
ncbi:MAG: DUF5104 domain-containing protein [Ruminococcaceae bacterium]|nr:DUF5104 domain-containing protein [Oscillospiraceae bacterium]